jgi:hypothetical protein
LAGRHISPVQELGLILLTYLDDIAQAKDEVESLKKALAARPEYSPKKMFPEYFKEPKKSTDEVTPEDYVGIEWKSPTDDPEGWKDIEKFLAGRAGGFLTGDDVVGTPAASNEITWTDWE